MTLPAESTALLEISEKYTKIEIWRA